MAKRGIITGTPWHTEYHTVKRKKAKAADCVYLDEERICRNKKSVRYCEKCFIATYCVHRIKEKDLVDVPPVKAHPAPSQPTPPPNKKAGEIVSIDCTLMPRCAIWHSIYGKGALCGFDKAQRVISVEFECGIKKFRYPEAFFEKHLRTHQHAYTRVCIDANRAKRE